MRRSRLTIAITALLAGIVGAATPAAAATPTRVDIVKVTGLIDPVNADLVAHSVRTAAHEHALLLVLQVNSTGGTVAPSTVSSLVAAVSSSPVPVAVWVGGSSRARAYGPAFRLVRAGSYSGEAPGSRVGPVNGRTMSGDDAVDAHVLDDAAPTLVDFLGDLSGKPLRGHASVDLGVTGAPGTPGRGFRKDLTFDFSQLSIVPKLLHTAASPDVAFTMLLIALALVVFELYTAGVGVAAGTGVVFGALSAYGLGVLPTRPVGVVLLVLAFIGWAIDVQAGSPRFWTAVGGVAYVAGALVLFNGHAVAWWVILVMGALLAVFVLSAMPAMVRARFSTPTIGRESMIGSLGIAVSEVDPEGTVKVHGAPWRARTNRATPIPEGDLIRVVAIDGLLLEVEPESGGARDAGH
jgi:membrane-bound serine protease (ClpP class)